MPRKVILVTITLAVVAAGAAFAFDPDELNMVTFKNTTGAQIEMIFLSPGDSDYWGPDLLGADYVMDQNSSLSYYIHYPEDSFTFDILAVDENGNSFELYDYQVNDGEESTITLTKKNLNKDAPDFTLATVELTNETGAEIDYLFLSPEDTDAWGAELLGEETVLSDGDTHSVVIPVGDEEADYYLMAVDEDNNEYQFSITLEPNTEKTYSYAIEVSDMQ